MFTRAAALTICLSPALVAQDTAPRLAQDRDKQEREEVAKLQGQWSLVSTETGTGRFFTQPSHSITIKENAWTISTGSKDFKYTVRIDATKDPKQLDQMSSWGSTNLGIYKVEGDLLTICWGPREDPKLSIEANRPREFKPARDGSISIYKRKAQ